MTILMSGVNMYAMAVVMKVVLGWNIHFSIWVSSLTVMVYVALGGLLSAIFNEVLQFVLIWLGALLIPILGLLETGGWDGMVKRIHQNFPAGDFTHLWRTMGSFTDNPMGIHWTGIVLGLGWVISFGYWTTDFLVVQRVLSAKDLRSAKMAPIIGAGFKMAVPFIVILPGLLGLALLLINIWVRLRWLISRLPSAGPARLDLNRFRLHRFIAFLRRAIERTFDALDAIPIYSA